ncbi:MAG: tetratricopeptide repeat protein [Thiotrichales bacterium]|nr:tetratricopeptide repeat protein [Thiotrichales bacterium]
MQINFKVAFRAGLLTLSFLFLVGCSQAPKKPDMPKDQVESQTKPLATDLSAEDEYQFALDLAGLEVKRQRYDRAEGILQKLRKAEREDIRVYRLLAQVYEAQKKPEMALIAWQQANKFTDKTISDEAELARLALMNEQYASAEAIYQTWLLSADELQKVSGLNNLGFSAILQKKYSAAKAYFQQALEVDPLNAKAINNLKLVTKLME